MDEVCPKCGAGIVPVVEEYPDMIGVTVVTTWPCCEFVQSINSMLEYDERGRVIDVR